MNEQFDPVTRKHVTERETFESASREEQQHVVERLHEKGARENAPNFYEKLEHEQDEKQRELLRLSIDIAEAVDQRGGLALVVGGYARDEALRKFGFEVGSKDIDIEVYGLSIDQLTQVLQQFGEPDTVGASFGVIKLRGLDISIPRKDSKTGKGHKGFAVEGDPTMLIAEAARRRDFTINALALNPLTGEIIDHYGGINDIQNRVLRATDFELFKDDPLRVLRAMQLAGRFEFSVEENTAELCRSIDLSELSKERVGEEWEKLLLKSKKPSIGLEVAKNLKVLEKLHPELDQLRDVPQDAEWHPEGDVWVHTKLVADAAAEIVRRENLEEQEAYVIMLAALCHDLGKPETTATSNDERIISHGHSEASLPMTQKFLDSLVVSRELSARVLPLVREHLFPAQNIDPSPAAVRRLAHRLHPATIQELLLVAESDQRGRALPFEGLPGGAILLRRAQELSLTMSKPTPILMGRHLIEMGAKPGPNFSRILSAIYEAQMDGEVSTLEEAQAKARSLLTQ